MHFNEETGEISPSKTTEREKGCSLPPQRPDDDTCKVRFIAGGNKHKVEMNTADFEGIFKFKLIIPTLYVCSWVAVFLGPSLFPVVYQCYCIVLWLLFLTRMGYMLFNLLIVLARTYNTLKGYQSPSITNTGSESVQNHRLLPVSCDRYYAFVIPSYKEDVDLLADTLSWIASHSRSRSNYLVFMAMERHEEGSEQKASAIISRFRHCFRLMEYTCHELRQHEHRGKASNVSWCVEHMEPFLVREGIPPSKVFITVIDADSWVPPLYIDKVEEHLDGNADMEHLTILVPPQIFTRNYFDVPVFVRIYDHTHSFAHLSNMRSCMDLVIPISNYTLSYQLIKRIGFWDTCADAVSEDFHMTLKAFWKTRGQITVVPIYTPFNQINVQAGVSYWGNISAKFWQAERHFQSVAQLAYSLNQMTKTKLCSLRACVLNFEIFVYYVIFATTPWVVYSIFYQDHILYKLVDPPAHLYGPEILTTTMKYVFIVTCLSWLVFEVFRRNCNRILYQKKNQSLLRILEYPLVASISFMFIAVPAFVLASFGSLFKERQFRTSEKVIKKKKED